MARTLNQAYCYIAKASLSLRQTLDCLGIFEKFIESQLIDNSYENRKK